MHFNRVWVVGLIIGIVLAAGMTFVIQARLRLSPDAANGSMPAGSKTLAFAQAGTVGRVLVKVGDMVRAGQTVATLQSDAAVPEGDQSNSADEQVRSDQAEVEREEQLLGAGVVTVDAVNKASAKLARDEAAQRGGKAVAPSAGDSTLRAPFEGVVTAVFARQGEAVDPARPVLAIHPAVTAPVSSPRTTP